MKRARLVAVLPLALALGALLRFGTLGRMSLWLDEVMAALASGLGLDFVIQYARQDVTPPGHYLLMLPFARLPSPEAMLRVPAAVSGVLLVLVVYVWAARAGQRRAGAWAALLVALHPYALYHSQDARMYSHMMLLAALCGWTLDELLASRREAGRWGWAVALAAAATAGLYNSYFAAFLLASLALDAARRLFAERRTQPRSALVALVCAFVLCAVFFAPWLRTLGGNPSLGFHVTGIQWRGTWNVILGAMDDFGGGLAGVLFWPAALWGLVRSKRIAWARAVALAIVPLAFLLLYDPSGHFFAVRYLSYLFPFLAVRAGRGLADVETRLPGRAREWAVAGAIVLAVAFPLFRYERGEKENWREAARILGERMAPGDVLLSGANDARISIDYYLARQGRGALTEGVLALATLCPPEVFPLPDGPRLSRRYILNDRVRNVQQLRELEGLWQRRHETARVWWVSAHPEYYGAEFYPHMDEHWQRVAVLPAVEPWGEIRIYVFSL